MTQNKSIDGLTVGRRQNPTPEQPKVQQNANKKQAAKKTQATTKRVAVEDFLSPVQVFNFDEDNQTLTKNNIKSTQTTPTKKSPNRKTEKPKKKGSKKKKITLTIIFTILALLIAGVVWFLIWGNDLLAKINGGNVWDAINVVVSETYDPLKTDENGRTNILAFGTSGYDMEGTEDEGTVHDGAQLTDSIMVISLNQETGDVAMISLPRDLIAAPTCTATGKINEVYWCNNQDGTDEEAGALALEEKVGEILGIEIQYYVHINWMSLISIVDALGGITVTLDEDIYDYDYTGAMFDAGIEYLLNGEEALGLARARHGTVGGDFSRGNSQQKVLIGIKDKIFSSSLSLEDLLSLAAALGDNLRTDLSLSELKTLAHLTSEFDFNNIRQIPLVDYENNIYYVTTGSIGGISYVMPTAGAQDYTEIQEYVATQLSNDPRDYEEATILVLNATETAGVASAEQRQLESEGFVVTEIGDAPEGEYYEDYYIYKLGDKVDGTVKMLEEYYNTTAKDVEELPVGIEPIYDIVIVVNKVREAEIDTEK